MLESYHTILLVISVCLLYAATYGLHKVGKISLMAHRRLWNFVLLLAFLLSCGFGVFLAAAIDLELSVGWYREILWAHVEFGIAMSVIACFHAGWHLNYYLAAFKKKNHENK